MKGKRAEIGLAIFLLIVLLIPLKRNVFSFIKEKPLGGEYDLTEEPILELNNWFEGDYQDQFSIYFENNFGFRNFFVRVNNQIQYSLYKKPVADYIISGNGGQIHQIDYINSYLGKDYIGIDSINIGLKKLDYIRNQFKKIGTEFIIAIAPGKVSFMPESLPDRFKIEPKDTSNYDMYIKGFKRYNFNVLDYRAYFQKLKKTVEHPLYTKGGVHWNGYAITIAADTLIKFIEHIEGKPLNHFKDVGGEYTIKPRFITLLVTLFSAKAEYFLKIH